MATASTCAAISANNDITIDGVRDSAQYTRRPLQPRAAGGHQRRQFGLFRRGLGRRHYQPGHQEPAGRDLTIVSARAAPTTIPRAPSTATTTHDNHRLPHQRHGPPERRAGPRFRAVRALGHRAVDHLRHRGRPHPAKRQPGAATEAEGDRRRHAPAPVALESRPGKSLRWNMAFSRTAIIVAKRADWCPPWRGNNRPCRPPPTGW